MNIDISPGIEAVDSEAVANQVDPFVLVKAKAIVRNYFKAHASAFENLIPVSSGEFYELEVINPDSGRKRKAAYLHSGKIDGIFAGQFQDRNGRFIFEQKITDQDISAGSMFWNRIRLNTQLDEYALAYWQKNGVQVDGIIFDAIRQPSIRPKQVTQADIKAIANEGVYCGVQVSPDLVQGFSYWLSVRAAFDQRKKDHAKRLKTDPAVGEFKETPVDQPEENEELFGIRFSAMLERSLSEHFAFRFVPITEEQIINWARELWTLSKVAEDSKEYRFAPRNTQACFNFNSACQYVDLCCGNESPIDENGQLTELSNRWDIRPPSANSENRLSVSRLKVLQECPRKHFLKHVAGIVPVNEPVSERLHLSQLVQKGIEVIWQKHQQTSKRQ